MKEELGSVGTGEPVTVNHIILNGSLVVLTDGRVLNLPAKEAAVTNVWSPSTRLEIWRDDPVSPFRCVCGIRSRTKRFVGNGHRPPSELGTLLPHEHAVQRQEEGQRSQS